VSESDPDDERSVVSRETLSDLSINAVPILMVAAFVGLFALLAPESGAEPLLSFHLALAAGIVLVSYVAARAIAATGEELDGERSVQLYGDDAEESDEE
jgi:hypothetical protein